MSGTFDAGVLARLHEDLGADAAVTREIVAAFLGTTPGLLAEGRAAAKSSDRAAALRVAHTLKSSAAMLGAMRLSALARELEARMAAGGGDVARAVEELAAEFELVRAAIEGWTAKLG